MMGFGGIHGHAGDPIGGRTVGFAGRYDASYARGHAGGSAGGHGLTSAGLPEPLTPEGLKRQIDDLDQRMRARLLEVEQQLSELQDACGLTSGHGVQPPGDHRPEHWHAWPGPQSRAKQGRPFEPGPEYTLHNAADPSLSDSRSSCEDNITLDDLVDHDGHMFERSAWDTSVFIGIECMGGMVSASLVLLIVTNMVVQTLFCYLIYSYMLDDPVGSETLDGLLRFRAGDAHNALYADQVLQRSLAAQVCDLDSGLHWANSQVQFLTDVRGAAEVGIRLCLCATVCWLATMIKEALDCIHFFRALWVRRGASTILAKDGEGVALHSISHARILWVVISVMVPRLSIVAFLTPVGMQYLVYTISPSELVLNAMALTFIIQIDEMFFEAFAPRRVKCLLRNFRQMPMTSLGIGRKLGGIFTTLRLLLLVIGIAACYFLMLKPVYGNMSMVEKILCSGDQDFIYSTHPSIQMVQATRSSPKSDMNLSNAQLAVLELAHPNISGWKPKLAARSSRQTSQVIMFPSPEMFRNTSKFDPFAFQKITATVQDDILQGSRSLICRDWDEVEATDSHVSEQRIRLASQGKYSNCNSVSVLCSGMYSNALRAICPVTCGCSTLKDPAAGFFASPAWGCPMKCHNRLKAAMGLLNYLGMRDACRDVPPEMFSTHAALKVYIKGFSEYLVSLMESGGISINMTVQLNLPKANWTAEKIRDNFFSDITRGRWRFAPGYPHPRGLTGCQFWTSWEVVMVFGINLCTVDTFRSLRMFCPESCGCTARDAECPLSCPH